MLGIITAVREEYEAVYANMKEVTFPSNHLYPVVVGIINNTRVALSYCGIGKVNAAIATSKLLSLDLDINVILNIGVVGATVEGLSTYDIVLVRKAIQTDFDCSPIGYKKFEVPNTDKTHFLCNIMSLGDCLIGKPDIRSLRQVVCGTSDKFLSTLKDKQEVASLGVEVCDMEAAAIAQVCDKHSIPMVSIKVVSDDLSDTSNEEYSFNLIKACDKITAVISRILE